MNVERFCTSVVDRVYTSTRTGCTDAEIYNVHAWLADYFGQKAVELVVDEPVEVAPAQLAFGEQGMRSDDDNESNPDE